MNIDGIVQDLLLWILVFTADMTVFTYFYKKTMGVWWWQRPVKKPYSVHFDSDGWTVSGEGNDPLATIRGIVDNVTGRNKTIQQLIDDEIRGSIQDEVRATIRRNMTKLDLEELMSKEIEKALKESLGGELKLKPEKKPGVNDG
jgi:hypothetical protein